MTDIQEHFTYIQKIHEDAVLPTYGTSDAACADICAYLKVPSVTMYGGMDGIDPLPSPRNVKPEIIGENEDFFISIPAFARVLVPTGLRIKPGKGQKVLIYPRSGFPLKTGLMITNGVGTVDEDYLGEVCVGLVNTNPYSITVSHGTRIAQICLCDATVLVMNSGWPLDNTEILDPSVNMAELFATERGEGGFGSTDTQEPPTEQS